MRGYVIVAVAMALASAPAMAGGKTGGKQTSTGDRPQESVTLKYEKVQQSYTQQKKTNSGKVHMNDITVTKQTDISSPKLMQPSTGGQGITPLSNSTTLHNTGVRH